MAIIKGTEGGNLAELQPGAQVIGDRTGLTNHAKGTKSTSTPSTLPKRAVVIAICMAFTPSATGGDTAEVPVPYDPDDGTTVITWALRRITLRVQTAGGAPAVSVEKSTVIGAFSAVGVGSITMTSGNYEVSSVTALGTANSGDKLRINPTALGTAANWTVTVEMEEGD